MNKKIYTLVVAASILFTASIVNAQLVFRKSYSTYISTSDPYYFIPTDAFQAADGNMLLTGTTGELGLSDYFIARTDRSGTIAWAKSYGNFRHNGGGRSIMAYDGNIITVGAGSSSETYLQVFKVNALTGTLMWNKNFEAIASGNLYQTGADIQQTADSGLVVCGNTNTTIASGLFFKLDKNGNTVWVKNLVYGGSPVVTSRMAVLSTGDIIVVGRIGSTLATSNGFVARFDAAGNLIWSKYVSVTSTYATNNFNNVALLADGNVIVSSDNGTAGYAAISKIDVSNGNVIWGNRFYYSSCTNCTRAYAMREIPGGQIIFCGGYTGSDFIAKIDASGNFLTAKAVATPSAPSGTIGLSINKTLDGANLWWSIRSLYKFKDNLTTCIGAATTLTQVAATTSSSNVSFTLNNYLQELTLTGGGIFASNMKMSVQSDCGGKCTTLDNLTTSFKVPNFNLDICPGAVPITLTNTSNASNSSLWKIDGTTVATTTNLTYNFTSIGTHTVQLIGGSVSGCYDTSSTQIIVNSGCNPPPGPIPQFSRSYSNMGAGRDVIQTSDGGYAITGSSNSEMGIAKLDASGNQQWAWQYGNLSAGEAGGQIFQMSDGGYLTIGNEGQHMMLVKLNSSGSFLWSYHYRVGNSTAYGPDLTDGVMLPDGSVIVVGNLYMSSKYNGFLCRIDPAGNIVWEKHFLDANTDTYVRGITAQSNGNFLVMSQVSSGGVAFSIDQNGNVLWSRKMGGGTVSNAVELPNGEFVCCTASGSFVGTMKFTANGDAYFYKSYYNTQPGSYSNAAYRIMKAGPYGYISQSIYNNGAISTFLLDNEGNAIGGVNAANAGFGSAPIWTTDNAVVFWQSAGLYKFVPSPAYTSCNAITSIPQNSPSISTYSPTAWSPAFASFFFDDPQTLFNYAFTLNSTSSCNSNFCGVMSGFTGQVTACTGELLNFTNTSFNGVSYQWKENGVQFATTTNATRTYGSTGTYTIRLVAIGSSGCKDSLQISVVVSSGVTANAGTDASIICGGNTTLNASGGTIYSWSPASGLSNPNISNPVASPSVTTPYVVFVGNGGSCTGRDTVLVTVTGGPTVNVSGPASICSGGSTTITASGATTYVWSPAAGLSSTTASSPNASPTITTTYTVTGTTSGCSGVNTVTVTVNTSPTVSASATFNTLCSGNPTTLNSSGANTYVWNPGNLNGSSVSVSPTTTTTYTVTGTAVNGCTNTNTTTITVNISPTVSASAASNTICGGGPTTLNSSGANSYVWNPGNLNGSSVSVSPTTTTTYTVTGTAGNGCTGTNTTTITVNTAPTVNASATSNTICGGGSTTLNSNGANTYVWNPGNLSGSSVSVSPTTTTTYTVTGTAGNGCTGTNTTTITVNAAPTVNASATSNTICSGNSTTLNSGGANTYVWNPGNMTGSSVNVSPTTTTTYTVTGTAGNGCTNTNTTIITVNTSPTVNASATSNIICSGGSTTLNSSGANTYVWNPGNLSGSSVSVSPTTTTTYTVTGTAGNGCTNTNTTTITVNTSPTVNASATSNIICSGGSTTLNSSGANTYVWNPGNLSGSSVSVSPTTTTTYTVTGTAGNGCTGSNTTTITVNTSPTVNASATSNTICSGSSTTLNSSGANTYVWNPGNLSGSSVSVSPTTTTTYTVTGTAGNGCTGSNTTTITVNTSPTVSASATSNTICSGSSTTLNSSGANTYVWNPGNLSGSSVSVSPTTTTTYTVTGTAGNGCTNTNTTTITVNTSPTVSASATSNTICNGNSTTLNSGGANTYVWNPGNLNGSSVSVSPTTTTTYTVTGTAANGCTNTNTTTITVNPLPTVSASATNNTICNGGSTTLNSGGANTYVWNPGNLNGSSVIVTPTTTTTYTVTGTAANGCNNINTVTITVGTLPTVTSNASSTIICAGDPTTLTSGGANTYVWNPGNMSGSSVAVSPTTTTTYTVTGTDASGCSNTSTVSITVNPLPTVTYVQNPANVCINNAPFILTTGSPASGTYSGPGVTGTTFDPNAAGAGTWNIVYSFTDVNGCTNTATSQITVGLCTGTNTSIQDNLFNIYPNPFNENISVKCDNLNGQTNVCIYDELGQLMKCIQLTNNITEIDTRDLASGIYLFQIKTNDQVITKKLVKTN